MEEYKQIYQPTKIIVLSELTIKEKELFYQMMILNKCKFNRIENNKYITNIRLLAPYIKKYNYNNNHNNEYQNDNNSNYNNRRDCNNYSLSFQERLTKLKYDGFITITIIDPTTSNNNNNNHQHDSNIHECSTHYPRFISLIANNNDIVYPKFRPFTW